MTGHVDWMQLNMPIHGDAIQMQGNTVGNTETVASAGTSAVAPVGAHYARIIVSVLSTVVATNLKPNLSGQTNLGDGKTVTVPANGLIEIPNILEGVTTITVTDV